MNGLSEGDAVRQRYARRVPGRDRERYDPLLPEVVLSAQARQRALVRLFRSVGLPPLQDKSLLEIGCGTGGNLLELLRLGFRAVNLQGNELIEERLSIARETLPAAIRLHPRDALDLPLSPGSVDIVYQATVFSSLLDDRVQAALAARMWEWARPGGGILWYDFVYDNPWNPDVRGVPLARIRALFPGGTPRWRRVTLAPPIGRRVATLRVPLYQLLDLLPFLRTHVLCWIGKYE